eukprot:TRINITY_DN6655_c0_g1_i2.p1 TRINITY_DN6655_c0_g1~~TRINITY_DN6655_c0_g1_i2.p1  ORF type:complete len:238 (+),score=45.41 TRINITY_DN6655_c0_g1_i2:457-1170(+)
MAEASKPSSEVPDSLKAFGKSTDDIISDSAHAEAPPQLATAAHIVSLFYYQDRKYLQVSERDIVSCIRKGGIATPMISASEESNVYQMIFNTRKPKPELIPPSFSALAKAVKHVLCHDSFASNPCCLIPDHIASVTSIIKGEMLHTARSVLQALHAEVAESNFVVPNASVICQLRKHGEPIHKRDSLPLENYVHRCKQDNSQFYVYSTALPSEGGYSEFLESISHVRSLLCLSVSLI